MIFRGGDPANSNEPGGKVALAVAFGVPCGGTRGNVEMACGKRRSNRMQSRPVIMKAVEGPIKGDWGL